MGETRCEELIIVEADSGADVKGVAFILPLNNEPGREEGYLRVGVGDKKGEEKGKGNEQEKEI